MTDRTPDAVFPRPHGSWVGPMKAVPSCSVVLYLLPQCCQLSLFFYEKWNGAQDRRTLVCCGCWLETPPSPTSVRPVPKNARRLAWSRRGPTFFASGASEGGKAGEGGVSESGSEGGSGLATGFATFTGLVWPSLKKCRARRDGTGHVVQLVLAGDGYDGLSPPLDVPQDKQTCKHGDNCDRKFEGKHRDGNPGRKCADFDQCERAKDDADEG